RIIADLSPSDSGGGFEDQLIKEYKEAYNAEDEQQATFVQDKIAQQIVQLGRHTFKKACVIPASDDLHSLVFPPRIECSLVTIEGKLQVLQRHDPYPVGSVNIDQVQGLVRYSSKSIQVLEKLEAYGGGFIVRASVEGRERCVKVFGDLSYHAVQREFDCLCKIAKSRYATTLRTPKLIGLVESADDGREIGIVEEYISHVETYEMSNLARIGDVAVVDINRREKWSLQIRDTIAQLHEIGVVWGDAKTDNVLIDSETDDIYIIDFGGGYTDGWGAERTMNTIEGNVQALKKIDDYLQI
ncbi:hypothetical protein M434DRAFT_87034, partial [Hypoxylon sp. CO27-5]